MIIHRIPLNNIICTILYFYIVAQELLVAHHKPLLNILIASILLLSTISRIQARPFRVSLPLAGILVLGIIGAVGHELRDIARDIVYAINPILLIYMGYWLGERRNFAPLFFKALIYGAVTLSVMHLYKFSLNPEIIQTSVYNIRNKMGGGSSLVALAIILYFYAQRLDIRKTRSTLYNCLLISTMIASLILSFSRTDYSIVIIMMLTISYSFNKINIKTILAAIIVIVSIVVGMSSERDVDNTDFISKTARSFEEMAIADYSSNKDINDNWRGYETYRAIATYSESSLIQHVIGLGFGALVDIGFYIPLGEKEFRYIPILHNGYAYILVKTGIMGLILYMALYYKVIKIGLVSVNSNSLYIRTYSKLLIGSILSLAFVMLVSGGMPECATPSIVLLVGYLINKLVRNNFIEPIDKLRQSQQKIA